MRNACVLTVVSMFLLVAPLPAQRSGANDAGIAKVRSDYAKAANAGDAAALAALYAPDGVEMPPNHAMVKGRAAIEAYHKDLSAQMGTSNLTITSMESAVHGDAAQDVGTYSQRLTPKAGGAQPMQDTGKYVVLLKKGTDGAWHIAYTIYNSDQPAQPSAAGR